MRTVLLTFVIAGLAGACGLYFDSNGSNSGGQPDAGSGQQPLPDASTEDNDAGPNTDAGPGGCNQDAGVDGPDFPPDAGQWPDAAPWPVDANTEPPDAQY